VIVVLPPNPQKEIIAPPDGKCVHVDMPNDRYHRMGNWSHSQLKYLPDEPEMFEWKYILRRVEFSQTRAMVMGSALHAWLLEQIKPTLVPQDFLTKAGSVAPGGWEKIGQALPNVPVIKRDEFSALSYAREHCLADPQIKAYLETQGYVEHSLFMVDQATGLPTRVRLDKLCQFRNALDILDLKFSGGCDDRWIEKQVTGMGYYSQAGMYWEHTERAYSRPNRWVFLFVENVPPFRARLKELAEHDVELGMRHTHISLAEVRARLASGDWRGHGFGRCTLTQVLKWKWDENPGSVEPFTDFMEFANNADQ
jgi:hypothetical protein